MYAAQYVLCSLWHHVMPIKTHQRIFCVETAINTGHTLLVCQVIHRGWHHPTIILI